MSSLPKFMFLHEDSEQLHDKRVQTHTYYDENSANPTEKLKKRKITSTFPLASTPYNSSLFNLGTFFFIQSTPISMA
jgi:hypothetical protein